MKTHASLGDLPIDEADRFGRSFVSELQQGEQALNGRITWVTGKLEAIDPTSVEYALAVAALATEGNNVFREQWSRLMRIIATVRPPMGRGRPKKTEPPAKFGGMWPHERLGHRTWTEFVEAPRGGEKDWKQGKWSKPPGLGLTRTYEANLFAGWQKIHSIIGVAFPDASPDEREAVADRIVEKTGPAAIERVGKISRGAPTYSQDEAVAVVDSLTSGEVTERDVKERGPDALLSPRKRGERKAKPVEVDEVEEAQKRFGPDPSIPDESPAAKAEAEIGEWFDKLPKQDRDGFAALAAKDKADPDPVPPIGSLARSFASRYGLDAVRAVVEGYDRRGDGFIADLRALGKAWA